MKTSEKVIGYIGAPLHYPNEGLGRFKIFSPEDYRKRPKDFWRYFDPEAVRLSMMSSLLLTTMISYEVRQKVDTKDLIYRPTNFLHRIRRKLINRINQRYQGISHG